MAFLAFYHGVIGTVVFLSGSENIGLLNNFGDLRVTKTLSYFKVSQNQNCRARRQLQVLIYN